MSDLDLAKVRRIIIAAIYNVIGAGSPGSDDEVEKYLQTPIQEVLGGSAPAEARERVARLIAKRTNDYLEKEYGPSARVAQPDWLTQDESALASTYADRVVQALGSVLQG